MLLRELLRNLKKQENFLLLSNFQSFRKTQFYLDFH